MMLLDYFGVFGWTSEKWTKSANFGYFGIPRSSIHVFFSCFFISLFRGLVYWTNEDPISV